MSGSDEIPALVRRLHAVAGWLRDDVRRWEAARDRRAVFGYAYAMRGSQRERSPPFKLQPRPGFVSFPGSEPGLGANVRPSRAHPGRARPLRARTHRI